MLKDDECLAFFFEESKKIKDDTINKTASEIEIEKESQSSGTKLFKEQHSEVNKGRGKRYVSQSNK